MGGLGRVVPPDWKHVEKFPLSALAVKPTQVPVVLGINWHTAFDAPVKHRDGTYWIGTSGPLGSVRGGHCVCLEPYPGVEHDLAQRWWSWYNQGVEGACVGFGCSRAQSLMKRQTFEAFWLYHQAQAIDGQPLPHEGTEVRCGLEILRTKGHVLGAGQVDVDHGTGGQPDPRYGIKEYRWATSASEVLSTLGMPGDYVNVLNSWGPDYPHRVRMPATVLDTLLREQGEAGVVVES